MRQTLKSRDENSSLKEYPRMFFALPLKPVAMQNRNGVEEEFDKPATILAMLPLLIAVLLERSPRASAYVDIRESAVPGSATRR